MVCLLLLIENQWVKNSQRLDLLLFRILGVFYSALFLTIPNGYPYGIPLNYVFARGKIYFHCAGQGHKTDNIAYNNRVSFTVVTRHDPIPDKFSTNFESAVVFGRAIEVNEIDEKRYALVEMIKKFSHGFMEKGLKYIDSDINKTTVFGIKPEKISGKRRK